MNASINFHDVKEVVLRPVQDFPREARHDYDLVMREIVIRHGDGTASSINLFSRTTSHDPLTPHEEEPVAAYASDIPY